MHIAPPYNLFADQRNIKSELLVDLLHSRRMLVNLEPSSFMPEGSSFEYIDPLMDPQRMLKEHGPI